MLLYNVTSKFVIQDKLISNKIFQHEFHDTYVYVSSKKERERSFIFWKSIFLFQKVCIKMKSLAYDKFFRANRHDFRNFSPFELSVNKQHPVDFSRSLEYSDQLLQILLVSFLVTSARVRVHDQENLRLQPATHVTWHEDRRVLLRSTLHTHAAN